MSNVSCTSRLADMLRAERGRRFYRNSLEQLKRATAHFQQEQLSFAVHLGDIVDGKQKKAAQDAYGTASASSMTALKRAIDAFNLFQGHTYHVVGNHCLYNFTRPELYEQCAPISSACLTCAHYLDPSCASHLVGVVQLIAELRFALARELESLRTATFVTQPFGTCAASRYRASMDARITALVRIQRVGSSCSIRTMTRCWVGHRTAQSSRLQAQTCGLTTTKRCRPTVLCDQKRYAARNVRCRVLGQGCTLA